MIWSNCRLCHQRTPLTGWPTVRNLTWLSGLTKMIQKKRPTRAANLDNRMGNPRIKINLKLALKNAKQPLVPNMSKNRLMVLMIFHAPFKKPWPLGVGALAGVMRRLTSKLGQWWILAWSVRLAKWQNGNYIAVAQLRTVLHAKNCARSSMSSAFIAACHRRWSVCVRPARYWMRLNGTKTD